MKIAVSGKGGVGKTLLSAFLARAFATDGWDVIAIDADKIVPVSHLKSLIDEWTEARDGYSAAEKAEGREIK
jgi:CO dehydrogenase maturation factor